MGVASSRGIPGRADMYDVDIWFKLHQPGASTNDHNTREY